MSTFDLSRLPFDTVASEVIRRCELTASEAGDPPLSDKQISDLMLVLVHLIAERAQAGSPMLIENGNKTMTATDAVIAATTILESARIEVFELAAWQANTNIGSVKRKRMENIHRSIGQ